MSDPWEGLGAVEIESDEPPAWQGPPAPEPSALEQMAMLGGMEPGGGRDYQSPVIQKAQMDAAGPSLWEAAKIAAPMALPGGAGLGVIGRSALQAAEAGGTTAAFSALEDDRWGSDPMAAAWEALASGAKSAAVAGPLAGVATGVEKAAGFVRPYLEAGARRAQSAVEGISGPTFRNLAKSHGLDWTRDDLAQAAIDTAPAHSIPQTTDWYRTQRAAQKEAAGADYGAAIGKLDSDVPQAIGLDDFTQRLDDHSDQYLRSTIKEERAKAGIVDEYRDTVAGMHGTGQVGDISLSPSQLQAEKYALTQRGYPKDATMSVSEADRAATYRDAASVPRQAIEEAALRASPETQAHLASATQNFGVADTLADSTARKAMFDQSQPRGGMWDSIYGPVRDRIPDATSMALQGAGRGMSALEEWGAGMSQTVPRLAGASAGKDWEERVNEGSRGHQLEGAALQALATNPQSLGKYAQRFQEAQESGEPMRMAALLAELNDDPEYRRTVGMQLKQATGRQGGF